MGLPPSTEKGEELTEQVQQGRKAGVGSSAGGGRMWCIRLRGRQPAVAGLKTGSILPGDKRRLFQRVKATVRPSKSMLGACKG